MFGRNLLIHADIDRIRGRLRIAEGASFDSQAQEHNSGCLPNTRVDLLKQIAKWVGETDIEPLFWLSGMAGTGKSTISRSVALSLANKGQLGGSFFFKKGEADRGGISKLFTTIAGDLMFRRPATITHMKTSLDSDSSLTTKGAAEQFEKLILLPLLKSSGKSEVTVLVIDALDECDNDDDVKLVLRLFSQFKARASGQVKVFMTSRPELPIRLGFSAIRGTYQDLVLQDIPRTVIEHDIRVFLEHELVKIRNDYNDWAAIDEKLENDWPSQEHFHTLVLLAVPLFIAATTLCRFLGEIRIGPPSVQLEMIISRAGDEVSQLGRIYRPVLDNLTAGLSSKQKVEVLDDFRRIIGPIILLATPLSVSELAKLLSLPKSVISGRLALLHSVLSVPASTKLPVRLLHLSFRNFLVDQGESEMPFWIDEKKTHATIARRCLRVLRCLKQDICDVQHPGTSRSAISPQTINSCLSSEVQYACLYWPYHIQQGAVDIYDGSESHTFLKCHFLHWVEALSLMDRVLESHSLITTLQSQIKASTMITND